MGFSERVAVGGPQSDVGKGRLVLQSHVASPIIEGHRWCLARRPLKLLPDNLGLHSRSQARGRERLRNCITSSHRS